MPCSTKSDALQEQVCYIKNQQNLQSHQAVTP